VNLRRSRQVILTVAYEDKVVGVGDGYFPPGRIAETIVDSVILPPPYKFDATVAYGDVALAPVEAKVGEAKLQPLVSVVDAVQAEDIAVESMANV